MRINAGSQLNAGSNERAWQCPRGAIRARSQVPATNPSRVCLMSAKRKRSYDVAMKLQAVDVAETTSKEAAATQFGVDSMEFIWRGR